MQVYLAITENTPRLRQYNKVTRYTPQDAVRDLIFLIFSYFLLIFGPIEGHQPKTIRLLLVR